MARTAADWIASLGLTPHPEGGFYRETYRAAELIDAEHLPTRFGGPRAHSTAIYFLLPGDHKTSYALVGGTVAPGFDFADFELADRATLLARFPEHRTPVLRLTR